MDENRTAPVQGGAAGEDAARGGPTNSIAEEAAPKQGPDDPRLEEKLWAAAGRGVPGAEDLARAAATATKAAEKRTGGNGQRASAVSESGLPYIDAGCRDLPVITKAAWAAVEAGNTPARLFLRAGAPSRLDRDEHGVLLVHELNESRLRHEVARAATWFKWRSQGGEDVKRVPDMPPLSVVRDMLGSPSFPLPPLRRIVQAPCFSPDGKLLLSPGYHEAGGVFIDTPTDLEIPDVPDKPTAADIEAALGLIGELFVDFPFATPADSAHIVALLLLGFVRDMVPGPTPLFLADGPVPGSGKGLAVSVALLPAFGETPYLLALSGDDDETRKALTSALLEGRGALILDNVYKLDQPSLAALLTTPRYWTDRRLGHSEIVTVPVDSVFAATGNNIQLTAEIARRSIRCRIIPQKERPWERTDFRHADLRGWAGEHRGELIAAALTLCQAWVAAGQPPAKVRPLGSFEAWTRVIGGILEHVGVPDFLENAAELYETADSESAALGRFVLGWWGLHQDRAVKVSELFPLALNTEGLDLGDGGERSQRITLGKLIGRLRERIFGDPKIGDLKIIAAGTRDRAALWRLNVMNVLNVATPESEGEGERG